ncbi:TetR/AcrR family transcriptional regulator [Tessaracoccus rhinocerotis]|uniref:TetR/AcrR family transcriptional regulator n=1 Tax=Tessaracoccus rhinocerotis TaxID=1689449 RepID=UPI001FE6FF94|nr:TetR/AcrR family transcriptional regulator [Tessaracoccus rhinocerotis]
MSRQEFEVVDHTGRGDPLQSLQLLWRTHTKTGRSGLSLDAIVDAAVALASEGGTDSLSMRKLADRLHVGAMSLYAYVPGKAELIDLMVDRVNGQVYEDPDAVPEDGPWRQAIEVVAARNRDLLARHRWLLGVDESRPALGPGTLTKYDVELATLAGTGLDDVEIDLVLTLVLQHVRSTARLSGAETNVDTSEGEWWSTAGPLLAALVDPTRFPHATRVGTAAGEEFQAATDPRRTYDFGLAIILDGVEQLIERKTYRTATSSRTDEGGTQ